jgi:RsiW-degrading membrane proteinase PrsW (M82 family)
MRKTVLVGAILGGALVAVGGLAMGLVFALSAILGWRSASIGSPWQVVTVALALVLLGTTYGLALAWTGWQALSGRPGRNFSLPAWGWWLLALVVVLLAGQIALSAGAMFLAPLFHITAGVLPPLLFLALATGQARKRGTAVPARATTGSLAWGGTGGTGLGITLEMMILLVAALLIGFWLAATNPELLARLQEWASKAQATGQPTDLSELMPLVRSPFVVLAVLVGVGVFVPLIEEAGKALAVPLVALTGRRLTRTDGFLLGVAAGAGFAIFEGVLNGALALGVPAAWGALMFVRGGTAAIHCLASGLAGSAWQALLIEREWARSLVLAALAIALHGAWNVLAGAQTFLSLGTIGAAGGMMQPLAVLLVLGLMGLLWMGAVLALALIPPRLAPSTY